jgi:zinc transporter
MERFEAWILDGKGGGRPLGWDGQGRDRRPGAGGVWVDLDERSEGDRAWLVSADGLGPRDGERFLRESAWPEVVVPRPDRLLVYMRVPHPEREEGSGAFVLLRLWFEPGRTISMGRRGIPELVELKRRLRDGRGPASTGEILLELVEQTALRISEVVVPLRVSAGDLEAAFDEESRFPVGELRRVWRRALGYERYVDPQRDLLLRILGLGLPWLEAPDVSRRWHAAVGFFETLAHEIDSILDHLRALQDSLANRTAEQVNRRLYLLTVFSTILLPLSLVTGLFGSNIGIRGGNILGAWHPLWFGAEVLGLVLLGLGVFAILRSRRLL